MAANSLEDHSTGPEGNHYDRLSRPPLLDWFANPDEGCIVRSWEEVLQRVGPRHGKGTRAAILPNATMQYFG